MKRAEKRIVPKKKVALLVFVTSTVSVCLFLLILAIVERFAGSEGFPLTVETAKTSFAFVLMSSIVFLVRDECT